MEQEVTDALEQIPLLAGVDRSQLTSQRLGGLTNRNYRLDTPVGSYVLRLAGEGTADYIDRAAEKHNAQIAANAGVNAEVVYFNVADGTMLCRFVENSVTMDIERFRDLDAVRRAGRAFRQLHDIEQPFQGRFELFEQVDSYLEVVRGLGASLPDGYEAVQADAQQVRDALSRHELPVAPCHCDPMVENCLDTPQRTYIIDFEYAGNNDPMWDLGDLSVEGAFDTAQDHALLLAYYNGEPHPYDYGRMVLYKAMCDLLWTLWGVVQHANNNPAEDFWAYAVGRLDRCRLLMGTDEFPRHVQAVHRGR